MEPALWRWHHWQMTSCVAKSGTMHNKKANGLKKKMTSPANRSLNYSWREEGEESNCPECHVYVPVKSEVFRRHETSRGRWQLRVLRHPRVKTLDKWFQTDWAFCLLLVKMVFGQLEAQKHLLEERRNFVVWNIWEGSKNTTVRSLKSAQKKGGVAFECHWNIQENVKRRILTRRLEAIAHKEARSGIGSHRNGTCSNFTLHASLKTPASFFLQHTHTRRRTQSVVSHSPLHCILDHLSLDSRWDEAPQQHLSQNFCREDTVSARGWGGGWGGHHNGATFWLWYVFKQSSNLI